MTRAIPDFSAIEREDGISIWQKIEPIYDDLAREFYQMVFRMPLEAITPAILDRSRAKMHKLLHLNFDEAYFNAQKGIITLAMKNGQDAFTMMFNYYLYYSIMLNGFTRRTNRDDRDYPRQVQTFLKVMTFDSAYTADEFFRMVTEQAAEKRRALGRQFEAEVRAEIDRLDRMFKTIGDLAQSLDGKAQETAGVVRSIAAEVEATAATVEQVAAAIARFTETSDRIITSVGAVAKASRQAADNAGMITDATDELNRKSDDIQSIVTLLQSIASQTRLLSLNATIEAARLGDAGRGFAIVASEVKGLSTQTSKTIDAIRPQIATMRSLISTVSGQIGTMAGDMRSGSEQAGAIASSAEDQIRLSTDLSSATAGASQKVRRDADAVVQLSDRLLTMTHDITAMADLVDQAQGVLGTLHHGVRRFTEDSGLAQ